MKELTIEEKAQRYDEALERANAAHKDEDKHLRATLERIFHELVESEDERIRKLCEVLIRTCFTNELCTKEEKDNCIAWLEKKGDKSVNIDIESMVSSYKQRLKIQGGIENSPLVNMCLTAFRRGVENTLEELNLKKLEKKGEQKSSDKVETIVVRDFNSVFSKEQVEEIDKRIEESQRLYNAKLRDAMRKVEDFPMTD